MATVYTGWRGLAVLGAGAGTALRFTSESVNIPLEVNVNDDVHTGMRTDSVYNYGLVKPAGSISFPLTSDNTSGFITVISPTLKTILQNVLATPPALWNGGADLYIYRGDVAKYIEAPWIEKVSIKGASGQQVTVDLGIKAIFGEFQDISTMPAVSLTKARALMFNELDFASAVDGLQLSSVYSGQSITPREFNIDIETGIVDDDSYNSTNPRALRGFAVGKFKISGSLTFVGAAMNSRSSIYSGTNDTGEGNFIPWQNSVNIGDLFTIKGGIWNTRQMDIPGMTDIAVTKTEFKALFSLYDAGNDVSVLPIALGSLLS